MADYNVNMKQWNGTSFDNVLPLAFNSKALEGKSYDDIIQYVKSLVDESAGIVKEFGSYVGTGTYGQNNPTILTTKDYCPLIIVKSSSGGTTTTFMPPYGYAEPTASLGTEMQYSYIPNGVEFWYNGSNADYQNNSSGQRFEYIAFGQKTGDGDEYIITKSGNFTVPKSGKYAIELYGVGGGGYMGGSAFDAASGGASCQHYDSIVLTKNEIVPVTVGNRNNKTTSFGSRSVNGGGDASLKTAGTGSGNYGATGELGYNTFNVGTGELSYLFGFGAKYDFNCGGPGAVYLKYLGE